MFNILLFDLQTFEKFKMQCFGTFWETLTKDLRLFTGFNKMNIGAKGVIRFYRVGRPKIEIA